MNDNTNRLGALLTALIALVTAFLGVVKLDDGFGGSRLPSQSQTLSSEIGPEDVTARLWEDPVSAVRAAEKEHAAGDPTHDPAAFANILKHRLEDPASEVLILGVMMNGTPFPEDVETRLRVRYATQMALLQNGLRPVDRSHLGFIRLRWEREWPPATNPPPPTNPPLVIRGNLAWESAAQSSATVNFALTNPPSPARTGPDDARLIVPYEWFKSDDPKQQSVAVLWLTEEEFADHPLSRLHYLLQELTTKIAHPHISVGIVGPHSSDTLRLMATETVDRGPYQQPEGDAYKSVAIFSATASAPDWLLGLRAKPKEQTRSRKAAEDLISLRLQQAFSAQRASFTNLIQTDDRLARQLVQELRWRHIKTAPASVNRPATEPLMQALETNHVPVAPAILNQIHNHEIVLLAEADTFYGRSWPIAFAQAALLDWLTNAPGAAECLNSLPPEIIWPPFTNNFELIPFLRGLDGRNARTAQRQQESGKNTEKTPEQVLGGASNAQDPSAQGEGQRDYLARLASHLADRDRLLRKRDSLFEPGGIRAVGIVGSDSNDTLLILSVLKPVMPEAIFFTANLDARFWEPANARLTRNLLVASPFGLDPDGTGRLRFRDDLQTGAYRAVEAALKGGVGTDTLTGPYIYELGLKSPVEVFPRGATSVSGTPGDKIHGEFNALVGLLGHTQWAGLLMLATGATLLPFGVSRWVGVGPTGWRRVFGGLGRWWILSRIKRRRSGSVWQLRWGFLGLVLLGMALLWFWHLSRELDGEPMKFTQGVSVWPSEVFRLVAIWLTVGLIYYAWWSFGNHWPHLWRKYFSPTWAARIKRVRPTGLWRAGIATRRPARRIRLDMADVEAAVKQAASKAPTHPAGRHIDASAAFVEFLRRATGWERSKNTILLSAVYLVFGFGLFFLLGTPVRPTRGDAADRWDMIILMLQIISFTMLVFWVVYATQLSSRLLIRLSEAPTCWPAWVVQREQSRLGLMSQSSRSHIPLNAALESALDGWIDVKFTAEQTREVGSRFYLPFIIMLLMFISRSRFFDNWIWTKAVVLINLASLAVVMTCGVDLRRAARKVRQAALKNLDRLVVLASGPPPASGSPQAFPTLEQLKLVRARIEGEHRGAYSHFLQDPSLIALVVPAGGYSLFLLLSRYFLGLR